MEEHTPDWDGYKGAQARLRAVAGQEVPFFIPTATTWPEGAILDAQGVPVDPSVVPTASGFASASVTCSVVHRPVRGQGLLVPPVADIAMGLMGKDEIMLVMGKEDYDTNDIIHATRCEVFDRLYKIEEAGGDQVGPGDVQRMQIFAERM